jgi:hypothetical protein
MASNTLLTITPDMIKDLHGRKGKTAKKLFDEPGNPAPTTKIGDGNNESVFVLPYRALIILNGRYSNMKLELWDSFGSGGQMIFNLYDVNKNLLGTFSKAKAQFNVWVTLNMDTINEVRIIEISLPTDADLNVGFFECKLYGDLVGSAPSIYPGTAIVPRQDPGKAGNGINLLDDQLNEYPIGDPSTKLATLMAASFRIGYEGPRFDHDPETRNNPINNLPVDLSRFGNDHINTRIFNITKPRGIQVQIYHGGGSLKNLSAGQSAGSNGQYTPNIAPVNDFKYILPGADATLAASWIGKARLMAALAGLYGNNTSANLSGITITGGIATAGQGGMNEIEIGNELNRDWVGSPNTLNAYHTPEQWYALLTACYAEVKARNPNMIMLAPAVTYMDLTYWDAVYTIHYMLNGFAPFPCDGLCMNLYLTSEFDGQPQSGDSTALRPEAWNLKARLLELKDFCNLRFPNKRIHITENGFATSSGSPYDVPAIGAKTAAIVAADWTLRAKAIVKSVPGLIDKFFYYAFFNDNTPPFSTMAATQTTFNPGYAGSIVHPPGYVLANELFAEQNYNWWASETLLDGGTTGAWALKFAHTTNSLKKLFMVWRGTANGSTGAVNVPVGPNAVSATLYTVSYTAFQPTSAPATITGENVNVTADEGMKWLEVTYDEESAENIPPVANAGSDQGITLPHNWVTVNGSSSTDSDGTITFYEWTKLSGPGCSITNPFAASTTIIGLQEGVYEFKLRVVDNDGGEHSDNVQITVNAAPIPPDPIPNVPGGKPCVGVAKQTISFGAAGLNFNNIEAIYKADGGPLQSWMPGRAINPITGFEIGKGYYIVAKTDIDLTAVLYPPIS